MRFNCSDTHDMVLAEGSPGVACEAEGKFYYHVRYPCGPDKMYNTCGLDALCRLRHPHLQRASHLYVDDTSCTLLLPVYTRTLRMLLGKHLSIREKLARLFPLLSALAFLHSNQICHGHICSAAVLFCADHVWLCDLLECTRGSPEAERKDVVDLGHVFSQVLHEDAPFRAESPAAASATQLLNAMLDTSSRLSAAELCNFPAFDHCRKKYCTWLELRPADPAAFDEDHRLQVKSFLNHVGRRFPRLSLSHVFRAVTAAKRCQGVAGTEELLYCLLYMSLRCCGPLDADAFCADAEGKTSLASLKHLQLPIIRHCDGVLWTNHVYEDCLNKHQVERAYFELLLSYDDSALANVDPEFYGQFLGPAVRVLADWTQEDIADI